MADQKDERDLPVELQIFFRLPGIKNMTFEPFPGAKYLFQSFSRGAWESPHVSEIFASNKSGKIDLSEGRAQKSATFDPLNPRLQNHTWDPNFTLVRLEIGLPSMILESRI